MRLQSLQSVKQSAHCFTDSCRKCWSCCTSSETSSRSVFIFQRLWNMHGAHYLFHFTSQESLENGNQAISIQMFHSSCCLNAIYTYIFAISGLFINPSVFRWFCHIAISFSKLLALLLPLLFWRTSLAEPKWVCLFGVMKIYNLWQ